MEQDDQETQSKCPVDKILWSGEGGVGLCHPCGQVGPGAVPCLWSGEGGEAVPSLGEWVQLRGPHLITPGPEQPSPFLPQNEGNC